MVAPVDLKSGAQSCSMLFASAALKGTLSTLNPKTSHGEGALPSTPSTRTAPHLVVQFSLVRDILATFAQKLSQGLSNYQKSPGVYVVYNNNIIIYTII